MISRTSAEIVASGAALLAYSRLAPVVHPAVVTAFALVVGTRHLAPRLEPAFLSQRVCERLALGMPLLVIGGASLIFCSRSTSYLTAALLALGQVAIRVVVDRKNQQPPILLVPAEDRKAIHDKYREILQEIFTRENEFNTTLQLVFEKKVDELRNWLSEERVQETLKKINEEFAEEELDVEPTAVKGELAFWVNNAEGYRVTPLHIAVQIGCGEAIDILLATGLCELDKQDYAGATVLHHAAALGDRDLINRFLCAGANGNIQDENKGTYRDVLAQCHPKIDLERQTFFYRNAWGFLLRGNGHTFRQLTGATLLTRDVVVPPSRFVDQWKEICSREETKDLSEFGVDLQKRYEDFRQHAPPVVVMDRAPGVGYILRAGEDMPPLTIVGEYLGEDNPKGFDKLTESIKQEILSQRVKTSERNFCFAELPEGDYAFEGINGYRFRSMMGMVPSSFPNLFIWQAPRIKGREMRVLFFTAERVRKGDVLAVDYGDLHQVKRMVYRELRLQALEDYFRGKGDSLEEKMETARNAEQPLKGLAEEARLEYLCSTPTAAIHLVLKGILTVDQLKTFFTFLKESKPDPYGLGIIAKKSFQEKLFQSFCWIWPRARLKPEVIAQIQGAILEKTALELYRFLERLDVDLPDSSEENSS